MNRRQIMNLFLIILMLGLIGAPGLGAEEKPFWITNYEKCANELGDEDMIRYGKKITTPKAVELGKVWADYLGYDAPSLVAKNDPAPEIKPGLVITPKNFSQYPNLKKLLPESIWKRFLEGTYAPVASIKIYPTMHYYYSKGRLDDTKKFEGTAKIDPETNGLVEWSRGIPFPFPKNGWELAHTFDSCRIGFDQTSFAPNLFNMFNRKGKLERTLRTDIYWRNLHARYDTPPLPSQPGLDHLMEKGSLIIYHPYDIRGWAGVRTRYLDPKVMDEFIVYIPGIRRVRRLSGTDSQDPIVGTDMSWEDWAYWWQKLSRSTWPKLEMKIVGETVVLGNIRRVLSDSWTDEKGHLTMHMEKRPVWILEVNNQDYIYGTRRMWMDKETFKPEYEEMHDARGRLWRNWWDRRTWNPEDGCMSWHGVDIVDFINSHRTLSIITTTCNNEKIKMPYFTLRFLTRLAK